MIGPKRRSEKARANLRGLRYKRFMKRRLLKFGLVAALGLVGLVAFLWWSEPTSGICRATANRIQKGMSEEETVALIGLPNGLHGIDMEGFDAFEISQADNDAYLAIPFQRDVYEKVWAGPTGRLHVGFDTTGRVVYRAYIGPRSLMDRIRRLWQPPKELL